MSRPAVNPSEASAADATTTEEAAAEPVGSGISLEEHLPAADARTSGAAPATTIAPFDGLRSAEPLRRDGRHVTVRLRGGREIVVTLDPSVEPDRIDDAIAARERVLVEGGTDELAVIGVVATHRGSVVSVKGERVVVEGSDEVLIRSGRAALRLRADGDVELIGSRISASSRGLFRLVGRLLRLN